LAHRCRAGAVRPWQLAARSVTRLELACHRAGEDQAASVNNRWQVKERHVVGDGRQVQAQGPGDRGVRIAGVDADSDESRHVERCQAVSLPVLCHLRVGVRAPVADHDRNFAQSDASRGPPPLGAEVNLTLETAVDEIA
jgi:hypothetical protein